MVDEILIHAILVSKFFFIDSPFDPIQKSSLKIE